MKKLIAISMLTAAGMFAQATTPAPATTAPSTTAKSTVKKNPKGKHHHPRRSAAKTEAPAAPAAPPSK